MGRERAFFCAPRQHPRRRGPWRTPGAGSGNTGWGGIYATLIAAGHRASDLGRYTERQLKLYYREALRLERQRSARRLADVNAAFAGGDAARQRLKQLTD